MDTANASLWHSVPENYGFDTIIWSPFPTFTGARGAHKRHQEYNYSYHREQHSYQLFRKPRFDTNVSLLLFLRVTPFQPSPIPLLRVHLNGIGNVTIHLIVPKNYEFYTNVGLFRQFFKMIINFRFGERHSSK